MTSPGAAETCIKYIAPGYDSSTEMWYATSKMWRERRPTAIESSSFIFCLLSKHWHLITENFPKQNIFQWEIYILKARDPFRAKSKQTHSAPTHATIPHNHSSIQPFKPFVCSVLIVEPMNVKPLSKAQCTQKTIVKSITRHVLK